MPFFDKYNNLPVGTNTLTYDQPLPNINRILFLGASIQAQMLLPNYGEETLATYLTQMLGRTVTVDNQSASGFNLTQIADRWETIKSAYANDPNTLVLVHALGNTISMSGGSWGSLTTQEKDDLIAEYRSLILSIQSNGNTPAPINTSFRSYDGIQSVNEDTNPAVAGSRLYNENVLQPVLSELTVPMGDSSTPFFNWYDVTRNNYTSFYDSTHPDPSLSAVMLALTAEQIVRRIQGYSPLIITRVENPVESQNKSPVPVIFSPYGSILCAYTTRHATPFNIPHLYSDDIYTTQSSLLSSYIYTDFGGGTNSNVFDTADTSQTLSNDKLKDSVAYITTLAATKIITITGYAPGDEVELEVSAYRAAYANDRVGQYSTTESFDEFITIDASQNTTSATPGATMNTGTIRTFADANGDVSLFMRVADNSAYAYINGVRIVPISPSSDTVLNSVYSTPVSIELGNTYTASARYQNTITAGSSNTSLSIKFDNNDEIVLIDTATNTSATSLSTEFVALSGRTTASIHLQAETSSDFEGDARIANVKLIKHN